MDKRDDPNNCRPISIIPTVAKIFEKIICDQFCDYLNDNNLLTHCQSGFRSLHNTLSPLIEATNSWSVNIENSPVNGVIFIDLKKALDTIDHTILIRKLRKYGVDSSSLKWFESYLCDRNQKCSTNDHLSNTALVTCGVTRGSNLGPLLFLVYINDLPNCLSSDIQQFFQTLKFDIHTIKLSSRIVLTQGYTCGIVNGLSPGVSVVRIV